MAQSSTSKYVINSHSKQNNYTELNLISQRRKRQESMAASAARGRTSPMNANPSLTTEKPQSSLSLFFSFSLSLSLLPDSVLHYSLMIHNHHSKPSSTSITLYGLSQLGVEEIMRGEKGKERGRKTERERA